MGKWGEREKRGQAEVRDFLENQAVQALPLFPQ